MQQPLVTLIIPVFNCEKFLTNYDGLMQGYNKNKVKQFYEGAFGYQDIIKKAIKKHNELSNKKLRKDASIGIDMIFTYSPEMENIIDKKGFFNAFKMFINNNFKNSKQK